ncbi:MAG: DUF262 domain-containing protein [Bacteroidales bacterium]|jgi:hypothetical protein|nr:DUF262 domain-containing protein [Bacteroidales bacterium]
MNKYTFKDILENSITIQDEQNKSIKLDKIEIPKIQRDYAQGRESQGEVRERFLTSIFDALENNSEIEMDFVYGSVKKVELDNKQKTNIFTPLDGQQRLTTLYLLYWYIGNQELEEQDRKNLNILLKKFTYETRTSSRRFCEKITDTTLTFANKPSEEIKNLPWFYKSYKQDPTIKAMLNMLDAINEKYGKDKRNFFEKLQNLQFYILPLNGFNLTDELYMKMNARGKQLTDFENFKADLIKWMKDDNNVYKTDFQKTVELDGRKMPYYLAISQKIDTKWAQFLWRAIKDFQIEEKDKNGNILNQGETVDLLFIRLFYKCFLQKYYLIFKAKFEQRSKVIIIDEEYEKTNYETLLSEGKYQNFNAFQMILKKENIIPSLEKVFDILTDNWNDIKECIQPSWQNNSTKWHFLQEMTQSERVIFLAISLFLEKNTFDNTQFKQWMRVVWNIVENTDIDGFQPMYSAMELINELSTNSTNIYSFLADTTKTISSQSSSNAVAEECKKAQFIVQPNTNWENTFIKAEEHLFFKGSVGFIITDDMIESDFEHRTDMANKVFDEKGVSIEYRKDGHLFLRALISRYTEYNQFINRNYTDTDEKEHYLKKMLASDKVVRTATREWFSLSDENALKTALNDAVAKDSTITGWDNDASTHERMKRVHEALYKSPHLQNWMQKEKAIRVAWNGNHIWVSRPRSWYSWVMLDSNRNEVVTDLCRNYSFTSENGPIKGDDIDFFLGAYATLNGKDNADAELKLTFDNDRSLIIEKKDANGEWDKVKELDYVNNAININADILS